MKARVWFWGLLALFVGLRVAQLEADFDRLCMWGYERFPMGVMAHQLSTTSLLPVLDYADTHSGGELLTGLLGALSFRLLGPSLLALKLAGFALAVLAFVALWQLLRRVWGEGAARLGGVLMVLAPPTYLRLSLTAMGNHADVVPFVLLMLLAFHAAFLVPEPRRWAPFACGVATGFAVFHTLSAALVVLALVPPGLASLPGPRPWRRLGGLLAGLLVGMLPLLVVNLWHGFALGDFLGAKYASEEVQAPGHAGRRLAELFGQHWPAAATYADLALVPGRLLDGLAFGLGWLGWLVVALGLGRRWGTLLRPLRREAWRRAPRADELPPLEIALVLAPLLFAGAWARSNFLMGEKGPTDAISYRYLTTQLVLTLVTLVAAWHRLRRAAGRLPRRLAAPLAAMLVAAAAPVLSAAVDGPGEGLARGRKYLGYNYRQLARAMVMHAERYPPQRIVELGDRLSPSQRTDLYLGLGTLWMVGSPAFRSGFRPGVPPPDVPALLEPWPRRTWVPLLHGLGTYVGQFYAGFSPDGRRGFAALLEGLSPQAAAHVVDGMAPVFDAARASELDGRVAAGLQLARLLPPAQRPFLARGLGREAARHYEYGFAADVAVLVGAWRDALDEPQRRAFAFGLGAGGDGSPGDDALAGRVAADFGPDGLEAWCRGVGYRLALQGDGDEALLAACDAPPARLAAVGQGFRLYPDVGRVGREAP